MSCPKIGALAALPLFILPLLSCAAVRTTLGGSGRIPVVFDTDICGDIDDTWALSLLLQSDEFDVKLITTAVGNTEAKAKVVAKFLETVGRPDIPIGIGVQHHTGPHRQTPWAAGYDLSSYPGTIYRDGVKAIVDTVMKSRGRIKIVAVGPLPNIAQAIKQEPQIAARAEFVGMHGSVRRGYNNSEKISAEYNVRAYPTAARIALSAPWQRTLITPLDTCGIVHLKGEKYKKVFDCDSDLTRALIDNYRVWYRQGILDQNKDIDPEELEKRVADKVNSSSTTLFDTVAVYLAMSTDLVKIERLPIQVTDDGYTRIVEGATPIECATEWKDLPAFEDFLVERLTGQ
jgi:inosine-uridine nucleoside N-ribohydrolase